MSAENSTHIATKLTRNHVFREPIIDGQVVLIPLTKGHTAILDFDVWTRNALFWWPWCVQLAHNGRCYAIRRTSIFGEAGVKLYMHRLVLCSQSGQRLEVDHRNGNGLDNRRENLRLCNKQQQNFNSGVRRQGRRFKGVFLRESRWRRRRWKAEITIDGKAIHLGSFFTPEEAAIAYNKAAMKYQGEFAWLNQVEEQTALT